MPRKKRANPRMRQISQSHLSLSGHKYSPFRRLCLFQVVLFYILDVSFMLSLSLHFNVPAARPTKHYFHDFNASKLIDFLYDTRCVAGCRGANRCFCCSHCLTSEIANGLIKLLEPSKPVHCKARSSCLRSGKLPLFRREYTALASASHH